MLCFFCQKRFIKKKSCGCHEFFMEFTSLNNFGKALCKDHLRKVKKMVKWYKMRSYLKALLTDGQIYGRTHGRWTTDNGP